MKIKIVKDYAFGDSLRVYLYNETQRDLYVVKPVQLVASKVEEGALVDPTFTLSRHEASDFIRSMAEIAEAWGIKTDKQLQEEGKAKYELGAIRYHLEDMRKLVFKK